MVPRWCAGCGLLAGLLVGVPVRAESTLEWRTPNGCPGHAHVVARIEELAPSALADDDSGSRFVAQVTELPDGRWRLELRRVRAGLIAERHIEGDSCAAISDAAAAAIALALRPRDDEEVDWRSPEPVPSAAQAEPRPEARAEPAPSVAPKPLAPGARVSAAKREPDAPRPLVRGLAGADLATFPQTAAASELDVRARFGRVVSLEGTAALLPPQRSSAGGGNDARFTLLSGGLRACGATSEGRIRFAACAGGEAGVISAEGEGVSRPRTRSLPWLAPAGTLIASWPLGDRARVVGLASLLVPLVRHQFRVLPDPPFHRLPVVAGRVLLGVELGAR